jgi:uncharacterized Fe-S cluster-containing radical SAM superfamily protein
MNILVTTRCNRRCPYCFAQDEIAYPSQDESPKKKPRFISKENFSIALDYARKEKQPSIGILGGEPSLHPQFTDLLIEAWQRGQHTKVFTNGLWQEEQIRFMEALAPKYRALVNLVVNVNEPEHTPAKHQAAQNELLSRLHEITSISFNIFHKDFDPLFIVDLISKHQLKPTIRLGIAEPLADLDNAHVDISEYSLLAPTLLALADRCDQNDIRLGFDCGFTLCMFTPEEIGRLFLAGARFKASCGPAIDIGTDLTTWSCFPLSTFSEGKKLTEFECLKDVAAYFRKQLQPLFEAGALPECVECRHRRRKQCSGGCAAHVYRKLNP